jgi:hypothetical protein
MVTTKKAERERGPDMSKEQNAHKFCHVNESFY